MISSRILSSLLPAASVVLLSACSASQANIQTPPTPAQIAQPVALTATGYEAADPDFAQPYIDVDEWRDTPVRHRYVHGGFTGTDTRFSYYFPPAGSYEGRFFQHVTPIPDSENLAQATPPGVDNKIGFSIASGAFFVETNGGGRIDLTKGSNALADPTITAYRANAAAAQFARHVARQVYGSSERAYGYIYGGSGGGFRTIGSLENTQGVWDGGVPYVIGSTMAIPNMFTVRMQALRVLRDKFPQIIDAMEAGGSGNPYAALTEYEASVLREIERMGFPMESWFGYKTMGLHGFAALYGGVAAADPTYFTDFWTKPGYLGHDHPEYFTGDRIQFESRVAEVITARRAAELGLSADPFEAENRAGVDNSYKGPPEAAENVVGYRLADNPPPKYMLGGEVIVGSGAADGKRLTAGFLQGDVVMLGVVNPETAAQVKPGDAVTVDNSNFLAMETYHRHQVPGADFPVWDQFRDAKGEPIYPQRPILLGPLFVQSTSGSKMTGEIDEKVIIVASLYDREAMPWQADWYRKRLEAYLGADADQNVRLWYSDRALHGDVDPEKMVEDPTRVVTYVPMLQQALRALADWVEDGVAPPKSTQYRIEEGQVLIPATAEARKGIQPIVTLTANGRERAEVRAGEPVRLNGTISAPPGIGSVVSAEWDFGDGEVSYPQKSPVAAGRTSVPVSITHRFDQPGTYFVTLRGTSQPTEAVGTPYARMPNLARVRVVVK